MKETISLQNLSIGYRSKHQSRVVAKDIHATLCRGELTCLIGVNGIGKSTLLRTLAGFQDSLSGEILLENKLLSTYSSQELAKKIGVVFTSKPDVPLFTVQEVVGMGRSPYTGFWGTLSADDNHIVADALCQVGISHLATRFFKELSDGEQQKVMIAKALAQQTPIILLDEPTAFLDYPSKVETLRMLRRLARELGKTIFLSSHDVELVLQIADKIWLMQTAEDKNAESHLCSLSIGSPRELADDGSLTKFLCREGISFDSKTLSIHIL